jgi:copper(I)-binding protein
MTGLFASVACVAALATLTLIPAQAQNASTSSIKIENAWARATPGGAKTAAVYMKVDNGADSADRLTGGSTTVASQVQVHEMKVENNVMKMREVEGGLAVPAKGSVTLKPGGYHVMLIGLDHPLKAGDNVPLELSFAKAGTVSVNVPVKAISGGKSSNMGGMKMKMN